MGSTSRTMCSKQPTTRWADLDNFKNPKRMKIKKVDTTKLIPLVIGKTTFYCKDAAHVAAVMSKYYPLLTKSQKKKL